MRPCGVSVSMLFSCFPSYAKGCVSLPEKYHLEKGFLTDKARDSYDAHLIPSLRAVILFPIIHPPGNLDPVKSQIPLFLVSVNPLPRLGDHCSPIGGFRKLMRMQNEKIMAQQGKII